MKNIYYDLKVTNANTQYISMEKDDLYYIQDFCIKVLCYMNELHTYPHPDIKTFLKTYFTKRNKFLPKCRYGQNSPQTFLAGIVNNTLYGTQRNLTVHVLPGIEIISKDLNIIKDALNEIPNLPKLELEQIQFLKGNNPFEYDRFNK